MINVKFGFEIARCCYRNGFTSPAEVEYTIRGAYRITDKDEKPTDEMVYAINKSARNVQRGLMTEHVALEHLEEQIAIMSM